MWLSGSTSLYPTLFPSQPLPGACGEDVGESGDNRQRRAADTLSSVMQFANSAVSVTVVGLGDGDRFHNCSCSPTFLHIHAHTPAGTGRAVWPCRVKIQDDTERNSNILGCVFFSLFVLPLISESFLLPFAAHPSVSDLHPGEEQPAVCRHDNQPDHLDKQPQPAGL